MTTPFDAVRALREEIEGLRGVLMTVIITERRAQEELGRAEVEYNAAVKIRGFVEAEITRKRSVLEAMQ